MGTLQNRYQLEERRRRGEEARSYQKALIDAAAPLGKMPDEASYDAAKRRELQRRQAPQGNAGEIWSQFQQANEGDYSNLATLDPLFGDTTAVGSAKGLGSRLAAPSHWGSWLKDRMTGSDTSHDYMMEGKDSSFDQPGAGRFQPYQAAMQAVQNGQFSIHDDLSKVPLSREGTAFNSWGRFSAIDPRNWLGWKQNAQTGEDRNRFRANYEKRIGGDLRRGLGTEEDVRKARMNLGNNAEAVNFDQIADEWSKNRGLGSSIAGFGESRVPESLVKKGSSTALWVKESAVRWSKRAAGELPEAPRPPAPLAPPALPKMRPSPGSDWYQDFANNMNKERGYSYGDLMKYRQDSIRRRYRENMYGKITGSGLTREEEDYGKGFHNRWNDYRAGGNTNPWLVAGGLMSQADRSRLDPVLNAQREQLLGGEWRRGMQVAPLIKPTSFGWTNPGGGISEWFGIVDSPAKQRRALMEKLVSSKEYLQLKAAVEAGKITPKDFYHEVRGNPVDEFDKGLAQSFRKGSVPRSLNQAEGLLRAADTMGAQLDANRSPYDIAQGTW
jgi:hypothetical protein